jgi:hypothetical protein
MGAKKMESGKIPLMYLTPETLGQAGITWSRKTLERRIKDEGFPAIRDGNSWMIPVDQMHLWFKKRQVQN